MKFTSIALFLAAAASSANAFSPSSSMPRSFVGKHSAQRRVASLSMTDDAQSEIEKLRAAAAKARGEAAALAKVSP